jgi:hypothetical protein
MSLQDLDATISFQNLILKLQLFWASKGCTLLQPFDMEMGAGTFHPATFLRAIGPEPWKAAYVQPSRRPTDGRYGENPNLPFSQTSQPSPQAPSVGDSQLSSTKRTSCLVKSSPISLKDSKYKS